MNPSKRSDTRRQVAQAVKAAESKKAEDVTILEMDRASGAFTDYFLVCSGSNPRQIQAIADEVEKQLGEMGTRPNSLEGYSQAEWVLLDYVDFVVHIFSERARRFYDLERLWKSARRLNPADLSLKATKPAAKRTAGKAAGKSGKKRAAVAVRARHARSAKRSGSPKKKKS